MLTEPAAHADGVHAMICHRSFSEYFVLALEDRRCPNVVRSYEVAAGEASVSKWRPAENGA